MITWQDNSGLTYDQWLVKRNETIGASEVGVIVYGNNYSSNLELFYEKIGAVPRKRVENIRMFLGKETESTSRLLHQYWDGSDQSIVDNYRAGRKIVEVVNLNATCFNSDYPHLSVTPDGEIQPFGRYLGRGKGSAEYKNTTSWYLDSFETGLPTDNVLQLCTQIMMCGHDREDGGVDMYQYGELFYFIDNMKFQCHSVDRADIKNMEELILTHTVPFWENVLKARPLYNQLYEAQRNFNQRLMAELQREIAALEPPPQNTAGYLDFLSEKYKDRLQGVGIINGNDDQLTVARKHRELSKSIAAIQNEKMKLEIELKNIIGDGNTLSFGKNGNVTWKAAATGSRRFLNNVK